MNLIVKSPSWYSGCQIYVFTLTLSFVLRIITSELTSDPRCCGPDQWEAVSLETVGLIDSSADYVTLTEIRSVVHYDYRNRRFSVEQSVWNGTSNATFSQTVHIDYNKKLKWTLYDRQCIHQLHTEEMPSPCIPVSTFSLTQYDNISMGIADDSVFRLPPSCLLSLDVRLQ